MSVMPRSERIAVARERQQAYLTELRRRGERVAHPDFIEVKRADELEVIQLGGDLDRFRLLSRVATFDPEEQESVEAFNEAMLELGSTSKAILTEEDRDEADVALSDADQAALRKLGLDPRYATIRDSRDLEEKRAGWADKKNGPERR